MLVMIKKLNIIILLLSVIGVGEINAQADSITKTSKDVFRRIELGSNGRIQFFQNDSLHNLVLKHIASNRRKSGIPGYRIRIFSDVGKGARKNSEKAKTRFYEKHPDIPVYRTYDSPYFKVYIGNFRTKMEAIKCLKRIKHEYPGAFVVPDRIKYPELD
jgi:hypothetical protein